MFHRVNVPAKERRAAAAAANHALRLSLDLVFVSSRTVADDSKKNKSW